MLEGCWFIHINPESIIGNLLVEIIETFSPHVDAFVVEPIYEYCSFWPNLRDEVAVVGLAFILS
jgi:hypothetical protein